MAKLYVVGIGPGDYEDMTVRAVKTLGGCELIVGYDFYIDLIRPFFPDKTFYSTAMHGETERCRYALGMAAEGKSTAVVCSGDAGIYGMAGLLFELRGEKSEPEIEVVSGLTAASSGAAVLGAPLTHDFAVISLSDLLTEKPDIEKRLECAAKSGFAIVLYNPSSIKRGDYLRSACDIIGRYVPDTCVCGVVRNIGRSGESRGIMTLRELREYSADMFTTVFVGSAKTKLIGDKMVTPRGYRDV